MASSCSTGRSVISIKDLLWEVNLVILVHYPMNGHCFWSHTYILVAIVTRARNLIDPV